MATLCLLAVGLLAPFAAAGSFESDVLRPVEFRRLAEDQISSMRALTSERRMQAALSDACNSACPGTKDAYTEIMTKMAEGATETDPAKQMKMMTDAMCPHKDVVLCAGQAKACQDGRRLASHGGEDDGMSAILCMCDCPKMAELASMNQNPTTDQQIVDMCNKVKPVMSCIKGSKTCEPVAKSMMSGGSGEMAVGCKMAEAGCMDKMTKVETCATSEKMKAWETEKCDDAAIAGTMSKADACCPILETMKSCLGVECATLKMASDKASGNTRELKKWEGYGKLCPNAGMPTVADAEKSLKASTAEMDSATAASGGTASDAAVSTKGFALAGICAAALALIFA